MKGRFSASFRCVFWCKETLFAKNFFKKLKYIMQSYNFTDCFIFGEQMMENILIIQILQVMAVMCLQVFGTEAKATGIAGFPTRK